MTKPPTSLLDRLVDWSAASSFDPERHVTSLYIHPFTLLLLRGFFFTLTFASLLVSLVLTLQAKYFFYLTKLSFIGLLVYFGFALWHSWSYRKYGQRWVEWASARPWYQFIWWFVLYAQMAVLTILVTVVFWPLLGRSALSKPAGRVYVSVITHGGNLVMFYLDALLARVTLTRKQFIPVLLTVIIYGMWMWMAAALIEDDGKPWWPYDPLFKFSSRFSYLHYLLLPFGILILFAISFGLHSFKESLSSDKSVKRYLLAPVAVDLEKSAMPRSPKQSFSSTSTTMTRSE